VLEVDVALVQSLLERLAEDVELELGPRCRPIRVDLDGVRPEDDPLDADGVVASELVVERPTGLGETLEMHVRVVVLRQDDLRERQICELAVKLRRDVVHAEVLVDPSNNDIVALHVAPLSELSPCAVHPMREQKLGIMLNGLSIIC